MDGASNEVSEVDEAPGFNQAHGGDEAGDSAARLFRDARTAWNWKPDPVSDEMLHALYDLAALGPTSGNCMPARIVFLRSPGAKLRLRPALSAGNVERAMGAPVVAIVAADPLFYEHLATLSAVEGARDWFAENPDLADDTARRNTTLGGAWLIMAARALGLDCAPMSGFDNLRVDETFLAHQGWRSDFLVCLGHADTTNRTARAPRLSFSEACLLL